MESPALPPPKRPDLVRVNTVLSNISDAEATIEDEGAGVTEAQGSFKCDRHGVLKFKFKAAQTFLSSTVKLKWQVSGDTRAVIGIPGKQTVLQKVNAVLLNIAIGPFVANYAGKHWLKNQEDETIALQENSENEIVMNVYLEKTCKLPCFPGLELNWSFEVENQRKVDYIAQFEVNRGLDLKHSKMIIEKQQERMVKIKHDMTVADATNKARLQAEIKALEKDLQETREKYEKDFQKLNEVITTYTDKLKDKDTILAQTEARNTVLEREMTTANEKLQKLRNQCESLTTECTKFKTDYWNEHELLQRKEAELETARRDVESLADRLEKKKKRLSELNEKTSEHFERAKIERERFKDQEASLNQLKEECKQLEKLLEDSRAEILAKDDQSIKDRELIKELQGEVLAQKDLVLKKDVKIGEIRNETLGLIDKLDKEKKNAASTSNELQAVKEKIKNLQTEHSHRLEKMQEQNSLLLEKIEQDKSFSERQKSDQQSMYQTVVLQLEKEKNQQAALHDANAVLKDENIELCRNLEGLTSSLQHEKEKVKKLSQHKVTVDAQILEHKKENMEKERKHVVQIEALNTKLVRLERERNELRDQCAENGKEIARLKQQNMTMLKSGRISAETQMEIDKVFFDLKTKSHEALQRVTLQANKEVNNLREQLARSKAQCETSQALHNDARVQLKQNKLQSESYESEIAKLRKENLNLIEQLRIVESDRNRKHRHLLSQKKIVEIIKKDYKLTQARKNEDVSRTAPMSPNSASVHRKDVGTPSYMSEYPIADYPSNPGADYPSSIEINTTDNVQNPKPTQVDMFRRPHRAFAATDDYMTPDTDYASVVPTVAAVQMAPVGIPDDFPYFEQLRILNEMGFWDRATLVRLLYKHKGDSQKVVQTMFHTRMMDCDE